MNDPRALSVSARGDREIEMIRAFDAPRNLVYDARVAGTARIPNAPRLGIVRAVAWDPAGNKSIPASKR